MNDNEEILALHRQLAAERLRADRAETRSDAKSRECIELRERMATPVAPEQVQAGRAQADLKAKFMDALGIAIRKFAALGPEDDEDWESWYSAAFDMLSGVVEKEFDLLAAPSAAAPAAPEQDLDAKRYQAVRILLNRNAFDYYALEGASGDEIDAWVDSSMKTATNEGDARDA
jgi:hypothetical protein